MKKILVGLTGGIGSGKSTVAKLFSQLNVEYIDVDDISRETVLPGSLLLSKISKRYGSDILNSDHTLNRSKLRSIIFNDLSEKEWLESVSHPAIRQLTMERIESFTSKYCLLVHPLLFETNQDQICDAVIAISVSKDLQVERVCNRDKTSSAEALKIINTQLSNDDRVAKAKYVIENTGNVDELGDKVSLLHQQILNSINE
ncbi:dephospho-CoA kinase [Marinomonas sp. 15G1-11]|uniref:Dephospho-CoA kinase n=1 Tax=Marinomonas phaeophyticola TaxID=3004091 RepID=A0ABT4JQ18_9GAMM|nr:dephospho-CoA kinase [Marinomonas sp. 15G1-11]MCZ2720473.1 dephospho-CoA kinase [Marinomonas sp. 15G1-11]